MSDTSIFCLRFKKTALDGSLFVQKYQIIAAYVRMILLSFETEILFQPLNDVARKIGQLGYLQCVRSIIIQ